MKFLRLAAWTLWFTLTGVALAHAGFIAPIIGAISSFIGGLGVVGQFLIGVALKVGLGLLQKALQKKPEQKEPGLQIDMSVGGDNPLSFIMGAFATAGQLEYRNTWGEADKTPNAFFTQVVSLSDLPLQALTGLWVDDQKVTLPTMTGSAPTPQGWPVAEFAQDGKDYLWIKFYDGSQTAADSFLTSTFGGDADRPWQSDQIGRGVAYAIVTARRNDKLFAGVPSYLFETNGIRLYDIRKDSSAGGSGAHRWNNPATWEVSNNPAVHIYNIIRGVRYGSEWVYGGQTIDAYQLPAANWMVAANACDEAISLASGGTEPRYRSGCQITTDQPPADVIESILRGCSGRVAEVGGAFKITVGAPGAAVYSFTDEQIIVTEAQSFDPFPGLEQTYNGAQASYPEPVEKWASKDAPAYLRSDLEVLDDNRRLVTGLTFPTVPYAVQVQRLLKEAVEDSRRFKQHQFYLPPDAQILEPGDVVAWTSARNSYTNKKFLVVEAADQPNLLVLVTLKEIDPSDFSWDSLTDEHAYSVGFVGPIRPPVQQMTGWGAAPYTIEQNGKQTPAILVTFDGDLDDVQSVRVQARFAGASTVQFDGTLPYGDPATNDDPASVVLNGNFLPNEDYEVRGIYLPFSGRKTEWSDWIAVTTPDVWLGNFYPVDLDRLAEDVREFQAWVGNGLRDALEELRAVSAWASNQELSNFADKQQLRTELRSESDGTLATATDLIAVATGPTSAFAVRITALEVQIPNLASAAAVSELSASVDDLEGDVSANASAITALQASIGDVSGSATFRMGTGYTPAAGWTSRIGLEARVNSGATFRSSGLYLEATASSSRIVIDTDQFAIMTGGALTALFDAGTAYIANARIRNLTAANISATKLDAQQVLQDGTLITSLISYNAIIGNAIGSCDVDSGMTSGWVNYANISCPNPNPSYVLIEFELNALVRNIIAGPPQSTSLRLVRDVGGVVTQLQIVTVASGSVETRTAQTKGFMIDEGGAVGSIYRLQGKGDYTTTQSQVDGFAKLIWWKR